MRIPIHLQREVARLHFRNLSIREIARQAGISAATVKALRAKINESSRSLEELSALDDDEWVQRLGTADKSVAKRKTVPDWGWVRSQMARADSTLEQVFFEWREGEPDGIGYSRFTELYRVENERLPIVMRQVHKPGDKLFADFAGRKILIQALEGAFEASVLVAAMGCSSKIYIEVTRDHSTRSWVNALTNAIQFFGGAPNWIVSDNLKAAVDRRKAGEIELNGTYRAFLKHYDTVSLPTRPRTPTGNAKAEVSVCIVQRLLFRLRDRMFFSLEEANAAVRELQDQINAKIFRNSDESRNSRFEKFDRSALKPLPHTPYVFQQWHYGVLVGPDYVVKHGMGYYGVPYQYRGERVDLCFTDTTLEIYRKNRRIALHTLSSEPGHLSMPMEFRPVSHIRALEGEPAEVLRWAQEVGPNTAQLFDYHLFKRNDVTNGVRAARRMRELARLHGESRFEAASAYAITRNLLALRSMESILKNGVDKVDNTPNQTADEPGPSHENIRGPRYFSAEGDEQ